MPFDPGDPIWPNRDRFVLSNGHASMLLWSVLHLTGTRGVNAEYERLGQPAVSLDDIRRFRQLDSKAPGHPEYHWVSGVEATTGPLGQGVAVSVGMAIAQKWLANRYNRPGFEILTLATEIDLIQRRELPAGWDADLPIFPADSKGVAVKHVQQWGTAVILSDGDAVFQPRKVDRSGLWQTFENRVLIYVHKERELDDVERLYPADHYVVIDDKLRILAEVKKVWGKRVTTVFPKQGHYALDPKVLADYPAADIELAEIGDLVTCDVSAFPTNRAPSRSGTT